MVVQHSFNPWWGCTRVSPGCDHCYAEALDARAGGAHCWLLLTKRPARIARGLPADWGHGHPNAWLGVTVENQELASQRIPVLLSVPARRRFLCAEPLLGPVDPRPWPQGIDWVIAGGESGPRARRVQSDWVRGLRDSCQELGIPFYFKQWGYRPGHTLDGRTWEELPTARTHTAGASREPESMSSV